MAFKKTEKIWMNGTFVDWDDATIHVLSHVVHYGTSLFEGIRCYRTPRGPAVLRLAEHIERMYNGAKMYRMEIPYTFEEIVEACRETIRVNRISACYIRPIVYRGYNSLGVNPFPCPVDVTIAVWEWGAYLGPEALEKGVSVQISSWMRIAPNTLPALAKAGANYMNSQLIKMEALTNGFDEGIALDSRGYVSEGSGENIFLLKDGVIYTPPLGASVLPGITRDSVITLARDEGLEVVEQLIPREALYIADELFFTGTAAEITPVTSVDHITVGPGKRGPVTGKLQERFFAIITGKAEDPYNWLDYV